MRHFMEKYPEIKTKRLTHEIEEASREKSNNNLTRSPPLLLKFVNYQER